MARSFDEMPDWLTRTNDGGYRAMVWIIPHANFLEYKGYEYPFHDVPEDKRSELYNEFRTTNWRDDAKKTI